MIVKIWHQHLTGSFWSANKPSSLSFLSKVRTILNTSAKEFRDLNNFLIFNEFSVEQQRGGMKDVYTGTIYFEAICLQGFIQESYKSWEQIIIIIIYKTNLQNLTFTVIVTVLFFWAAHSSALPSYSAVPPKLSCTR